jgi:hypothetical protein
MVMWDRCRAAVRAAMGDFTMRIKRWLLLALLTTLAACNAPQNQVPPDPTANVTVDANGMFSGPLPVVDLPIRDLPQETPVWCWAAVSQQIILASRGPEQTPQQCALVAIANGAAPQVCCNDRDPRCMRTGSIQQIQGLIQQFGGRASNAAPPTDPMTLYRTLAGGHAVVIGVVNGGAGHVVVARGMSFMQTPYGWEPLVHINDPMATYTQPVPFRRFAGSWQAAIVIN